MTSLVIHTGHTEVRMTFQDLPAIPELGLSEPLTGVLDHAGYKTVGEILIAPSLTILRLTNMTRRRYNELVRVFKEAGYLEEDACRWGQVPHREKTLLSEIPFGDLSESWLATFSQPGEAFESPAY